FRTSPAGEPLLERQRCHRAGPRWFSCRSLRRAVRTGAPPSALCKGKFHVKPPRANLSIFTAVRNRLRGRSTDLADLVAEETVDGGEQIVVRRDAPRAQRDPRLGGARLDEHEGGAAA